MAVAVVTRREGLMIEMVSKLLALLRPTSELCCAVRARSALSARDTSAALCLSASFASSPLKLRSKLLSCTLVELSSCLTLTLYAA